MIGLLSFALQIVCREIAHLFFVGFLVICLFVLGFLIWINYLEYSSQVVISRQRFVYFFAMIFVSGVVSSIAASLLRQDIIHWRNIFRFCGENAKERKTEVKNSDESVDVETLNEERDNRPLPDVVVRRNNSNPDSNESIASLPKTRNNVVNPEEAIDTLNYQWMDQSAMITLSKGENCMHVNEPEQQGGENELIDEMNHEVRREVEVAKDKNEKVVASQHRDKTKKKVTIFKLVLLILKLLFLPLIFILLDFFLVTYLPWQSNITFGLCNTKFEAQCLLGMNESEEYRFDRFESCDNFLGCLKVKNDPNFSIAVLIDEKPSSPLPEFARNHVNMILIRKKSEEDALLRKFLKFCPHGK